MSNVGAFADRIKSYPPYILTALKNKLPDTYIIVDFNLIDAIDLVVNANHADLNINVGNPSYTITIEFFDSRVIKRI